MTAQTAEEMFANGVDFITGGNHIFDKRDFKEYLETSDRVIRPGQLPAGGAGARCRNVRGRRRHGRCPQSDGAHLHAAGRRSVSLRRRARRELRAAHAESSSSTCTPRPPRRRSRSGAFSMAASRASVGTHTHVQTADEQILPGGTALHQRSRDDGPERRRHRHGAQAASSSDSSTGLSERFSVQKSGMKQFCAAVVSDRSEHRKGERALNASFCGGSHDRARVSLESFGQEQSECGCRRAGGRIARRARRAELQAVGAGAINQAIKAVAIARSYLKAPSSTSSARRRSFRSLSTRASGPAISLLVERRQIEEKDAGGEG